LQRNPIDNAAPSIPANSTGMDAESENRIDGNPLMIHPGEKPL
jgi:hypothetical protein